MISTCVHCKKEFEWEKLTIPVGCCHAVRCFHCEGINAISAMTDTVRPITQSKPLQVAKKWVVKIGNYGWLSVNSLTSDVLDASAWENRKHATSAADNWAYKHPNSDECITIEQVPA